MANIEVRIGVTTEFVPGPTLMLRGVDGAHMPLHPRFDEPPVVLLAAALPVAIPALALQVGGPSATTLAVGVALFGAVLLAWRLRLASPAVVAVGFVGVLVASPDPSATVVVAVLPVVGASAVLEYAARRLLGLVAVRLSRETEAALLGGTVAGVAWAVVVHLTLPATRNFGVVRDDAPDGFVVSLAYLVYAVAGPVLVVGLAVALFARFRLATPLAFAGFEVGTFLAGSGAEAAGSAASLLWIVGVPLLLAVAAVEQWLRTEGLSYARAKLSGS